MQILIFGRSGQVARELGRQSWPEHIGVRQLGRDDCDLGDADAVAEAVRASRAEIVINAAAYTAVDKAETEPALAAKINRDAPAAMAKACANTGAWLIHLSTDYVFDGRKASPYVESDPSAPLSVYGRTKADGEAEIRSALAQHVILRTSWVFAGHGNNFVRTMLRLSAERPELRIVCDQQGGPTWAGDIASAVRLVSEHIRTGNGGPGTFHLTGKEPTTWHDFALCIFRMTGRDMRIVPIKTADYPTAAKRPLNSILDCSRIARTYGILQPDWRRGLVAALSELGAEPTGGYRS
jgi:dTDP-4-dehydrorhamnose reductase